jgi:CheY-like chemotaxis protein
MANERILIVENDAINQKMITLVLEKNGYIVRTSGDGLEVEELCDAFHPDFILMDVELPGIDGLELTRRLRANASNSGIVIVLMTSEHSRKDDRKIFQTGCDGYLTKPISARSIPEVIESSLFERRRTLQHASGQYSPDSNTLMDFEVAAAVFLEETSTEGNLIGADEACDHLDYEVARVQSILAELDLLVTV